MQRGFSFVALRPRLSAGLPLSRLQSEERSADQLWWFTLATRVSVSWSHIARIVAVCGTRALRGGWTLADGRSSLGRGHTFIDVRRPIRQQWRRADGYGSSDWITLDRPNHSL